MTATLQPGNWPGSPPLCTLTLLPAFETPKALSDFMERYAPSIHITHKGKCAHCGMWHCRTE